MLKGLVTRNFTNDDLPQIRGIDNLSGNYVEEWIDSDGSFGVFNDEELVGYLTLGYADDCSLLLKIISLTPLIHVCSVMYMYGKNLEGWD